MNNTLKAALLVSSALIATPVLAQTNAPPPPDHFTLDGRGVDLISGQFVHTATDLTIGQPGAGGLSLSRSYFGSNQWRDNFIGTANLSGSVLTISIGLNSERFQKSGSVWTSLDGSGSTLTETTTAYTYKSSDGLSATFARSLGGQYMIYQGNAGLITSISQVNGEVLNFTYSAANVCIYQASNPCITTVTFRRLQSVTNNFGYQVKYAYSSNSIPSNQNAVSPWLTVVGATGFNMAVDYCDPSAAACSYSRVWPSATYTGSVRQVDTVTDQAGRTTTYNYAGLKVRLPGSTTDDLSVSYASGKVSSWSNGAATWTYNFTDAADNRTATVTAPDGSTNVVVSKISTNRPVSATNEMSATTTFTWDAQGRLTSTVAPGGISAGYIYDGRGNVTQTTLTPKPGSGLSPVTTSASFPAACTNPITCNLPASTTDARGGVTDYTYDASHGGLLTVTAPAPTSNAVRPQTRIGYAAQTAYYKNGAGTIVAAPSSIVLPVSVSSCATNAAAACVGTVDEVRQTIQYGSAGVANNLLPTVVTQRDGTGALSASVTTAYRANGDVASVDGPLPGAEDTTTYRYDTARRPVGVIGPDPDGSGSLMRRAQRVTYDAGSRPTQVDVGAVNGISDGDWNGFVSLQQQLTAYDGFGRPVVVAQHGGGQAHAVTHVSYDAAGRQDCVTQRMNPAAFNSLPGSACALGAAGAYGPDRIIKYEYDPAGRLKQSTSGYLSGAPITESATYTANGKPLTLKDGAGNVSTMVYDGFDRLSQLRYPDATTGSGTSSTSDYEQYGYDAGSNVISFRNRAGETIGSGYDALNRQVSTGGSAIADRTISYDNLNRLKGTNFTGGGASSSNTYDALGRLISQAQAGLGTVSYGYDLAGRRTSMSWPDGFWVTYDYNLANDLTAIRENGATNWSLTSLAYDNLGRPIAQGRANGATTYRSYDGASRLISLSHDLAGTANDLTLTYGYNPAGQIVSRTMSNPVYAYTPGTGNTAYANNGKNQVTSVNGAGVGYDGRGNIVQIGGTNTQTYDGLNQLTAANTTSGWLGMSYDPSGRLYQTTDGGGAAIRFLYDGQQVIGEYGTSGALLKRYVPGLGLDNVVTAYEGATYDRRYLLADERGSVVSIADGSANALTTNTYDEYGQPGSGNSGRFQYTGQMWLPQAQLYHYRARAYAPQLGRFMQTDPIGYQAGANVYGYVGADPVNLSDPSGLQECDGIKITPIVVRGPNPSNAPYVNDVCVNGTKRPPSSPGPCDRNPALCGPSGPNPQPVGNPSGNGNSGVAPPPAPSAREQCEAALNPGDDRFFCDDNGRMQMSESYARRACDNYRAMMESNREVSRWTGGWGLGSGTLRVFITTPKAFSVFGLALGGTSYFLSLSTPPPGCTR
ncbi:RHS repeat-associated core domain-containing protein [Brevundimonas sp.]|uniref:RHS repeat-associated core domain-containing protein n=1 Tax=Brevundimonas sp. TaxID=1871086 RepID=UPI003D111DEA